MLHEIDTQRPVTFGQRIAQFSNGFGSGYVIGGEILMLVWLADYLSQFYSPFSVVKYLTLRGIFAVITALTICWVLGPRVIRLLNEFADGSGNSQ